MKIYWFIVIIGIFLSGCVSMYVVDKTATTGVEQPKKLTAIDEIRLGMSLDDVTRKMGEKVVIGYQLSPESNSFEEITIPNPYKKETLSMNNQNYEVFYYFTSVQKADNLVADDELTPLIFQEEKLVGKGWDSLFRVKGK